MGIKPVLYTDPSTKKVFRRVSEWMVTPMGMRANFKSRSGAVEEWDIAHLESIDFSDGDTALALIDGQWKDVIVQGRYEEKGNLIYQVEDPATSSKYNVKWTFRSDKTRIKRKPEQQEYILKDGEASDDKKIDESPPKKWNNSFLVTGRQQDEHEDDGSAYYENRMAQGYRGMQEWYANQMNPVD